LQRLGLLPFRFRSLKLCQASFFECNGGLTTSSVKEMVASFDRIVNMVCYFLVWDFPQAMANKGHLLAIVQGESCQVMSLIGSGIIV
jgi:hypothetical protein